SRPVAGQGSCVHCSARRRGTPEQGGDLGPEFLPLLALGLGQFLQTGPVTDAGEVCVALPVLERLLNRGVALRVAPVQHPCPPGQVGAEPVETLLPPPGPFLVVEARRVLALTTAGQGSAAGGVVADAPEHRFCMPGLGRESVPVEASSGGVTLLEHAHLA